MRIAVLCATRRGLRFLEKLHGLVPSAQLLVFSFKEEPCEPPFLEDISKFCDDIHADFHEAKHVSLPAWKSCWEAPLDLLFCVSWRYMVSSLVYDKPRLGSFVFHDSLLPKYRGFSPTVWAMVNGETQTGATLFEMAKEVDVGPIVMQVPVSIMPEDYIAEVIEKVTQAYLHVLEQSLPGLLDQPLTDSGSRAWTLQRAISINDNSLATYGCKRVPEDNHVDWRWSSQRIYNLIRAVSFPYSGAFSMLGNRRLVIWSAKLIESPHIFVGRIPGRVVEICPGEGVVVLTGDGLIMLTRIQPPGDVIYTADVVLGRLSCTLD